MVERMCEPGSASRHGRERRYCTCCWPLWHDEMADELITQQLEARAHHGDIGAVGVAPERCRY